MFKQVALVVLMGLSASAMAGQWQVKLGGSAVTPTGDYQLGTSTVEADNEYAFTPSVEYFFNENISAELLLATPIRHSVSLDGTEVAKLTHLPPTITAKYNFKNSSKFTPYVGVGATAFIAWDESGVVKDVKEDYGFAGQLGFNYLPDSKSNWGLYADVRYADLNPEVTLTTGTEFKLDIDPVIYTLGYSYKF